MADELISMAELAKRVKRDVSTVHQLRHAGVFDVIQTPTGNHKQFVDSENVQKLIDYIHSHAKEAAPEEADPLTTAQRKQKKQERLAGYRAELRSIFGVI